jgi:hypothetical protein
MARNFVPQETTGTLMPVCRKGLGVERVDTRTGAGHLVETPNSDATAFYSDGDGVVRMVRLEEHRGTQMVTGTTIYRYRTRGSHARVLFGRVQDNEPGLRPLAVDGASNVVYALDKKDGRNALYKVALDGTLDQR